MSVGLGLSRSDAKPRVPSLAIQGTRAINIRLPRLAAWTLRLWTIAHAPPATSLGPRLDGRTVEIRHRRWEFSQTNAQHCATRPAPPKFLHQKDEGDVAASLKGKRSGGEAIEKFRV